VLWFLQGHLDEMLTNKHAHRVLMQLLAPDSHRYLPPAIYEIMHPAAKAMKVSAAAAAGSAGAGLDDEDEDFVGPDADAEGELEQQEGDSEDGFDEAEAADSGDEGDEPGSGSQGDAAADGDSEGAEEPAGQQANGSDAPMVLKQLGESKKDSALRRQELLGSGPDSLGAGLVGLCAEQAVQLLTNPVGSEVLVEVARGAAGGVLWQQHEAGVRAVHQAIVQQLQQDVAALSSSNGKQQLKQKGKKGKGSSEAADAAEPLLTHYFGSRALRRLVLAASSEGAEGAAARAFAEQLWQQALQGQCKQLVGGHAEKVLAGLLHCGVQSVEQAAAAELKPLVGGDVQQWAAKFLGPPGQQQGQQKQAEQQQAGGKQKVAGSKAQQEQQQVQKKKKQKKH
jgi:pumilio family protein 6